jgi:ParB family chromosome partitioning protein
MRKQARSGPQEDHAHELAEKKPRFLSEVPKPSDEVLMEAFYDELSRSIKEHGLLQPVLLRREHDRLVLIAGERRWRACKLLDKVTMQARILSVDPATAFEMALAENVQRDSLLPLDEARAYQRLVEQSTGGQSAVARRLGINIRRISEKLSLLRLPAAVQALLAQPGTALSDSHAILLAAASDTIDVSSLAMRCVDEGWSIRTLRRALLPRNRVLEPREAENLQLDLNSRGGFTLRIIARTQNDVAGAITALEETLEELRHKLASRATRAQQCAGTGEEVAAREASSADR